MYDMEKLHSDGAIMNVLLCWQSVAKVYTRGQKTPYSTVHQVKWTVTANIHESLLSGLSYQLFSQCVYRQGSDVGFKPLSAR